MFRKCTISLLVFLSVAVLVIWPLGLQVPHSARDMTGPAGLSAAVPDDALCSMGLNPCLLRLSGRPPRDGLAAGVHARVPLPGERTLYLESYRGTIGLAFETRSGPSSAFRELCYVETWCLFSHSRFEHPDLAIAASPVAHCEAPVDGPFKRQFFRTFVRGVSFTSVHAPAWFVLLLFGAWPLFVSIRAIGRRWRYKPHFCFHCGYNLTGNVTGACSECGKPVPAAGGKHSEASPTTRES